jgi:hypothetical protein
MKSMHIHRVAEHSGDCPTKLQGQLSAKQKMQNRELDPSSGTLEDKNFILVFD